ncbi:hypothetical protein J6590_091352 [Homalodisca vitripennis]|nr:hypothetical protein J6590_091352 [Homalodisca vitripennis]
MDSLMRTEDQITLGLLFNESVELVSSLHRWAVLNSHISDQGDLTAVGPAFWQLNFPDPKVAHFALEGSASTAEHRSATRVDGTAYALVKMECGKADLPIGSAWCETDCQRGRKKMEVTFISPESVHPSGREAAIPTHKKLAFHNGVLLI